jgi:alkylation response protein AidB-like acyl-CoA dehydrogenase
MDFELNEEQKAFRAVLPNFVKKEIKPVAMKYEREETSDIMIPR